jgi:hypothetical protein
MYHPFWTDATHMSYTYEPCRFRIIFFLQSRSDRQSMLFMTRHEFQTKFQQCNLDVLPCTIFDYAVAEQQGHAIKILSGPYDSS